MTELNNTRKNSRKTGAAYEQTAFTYLTNNHVWIMERNFRCRFGEIDLIGRDGDYLVFFEVKYRANAKSGLPEEAVGYNKQKNICKVADYYRMKKGIGDNTPMRFDIIAICGNRLTWYKNAFPYL